MPSLCDEDGEIFDADHAFNCAKGGLVHARHNELQDLNCFLLELAGLKQILSEPIAKDDGEELLRADWQHEDSGNLKNKHYLMDVL